MSNKKTKELIEITLKSISNEISMRNVKSHLILALNELNKINNKKEKTQVMNANQKWQLDLQSGSLTNMSLPTYKNAIVNIENLIAKEEQKIKKSNANDENLPQNLMHD
jgi:hypothetical protein